MAKSVPYFRIRKKGSVPFFRFRKKGSVPFFRFRKKGSVPFFRFLRLSHSPSPLFQHQWAAPHQCQNKFCRWLRLAPLVYLRGGVSPRTKGTFFNCALCIKKSSGAVSRVMWSLPLGSAACHLSVWTCCHASIAVYPPPIDEQP